jgi:hypothetical protein
VQFDLRAGVWREQVARVIKQFVEWGTIHKGLHKFWLLQYFVRFVARRELAANE